MNREIKFRVWDKELKQMMVVQFLTLDFQQCQIWDGISRDDSGVFVRKFEEVEVMQYTGLIDKNGDGTCIYEGDIVSLEGLIIGNQYEAPELLQNKTHLLIEGMGTKEWGSTESEAIKRGCFYAK